MSDHPSIAASPPFAFPSSLGRLAKHLMPLRSPHRVATRRFTHMGTDHPSNRYVKAQMPLMKAEATKKGEKFVSGVSQ